jgi:hypothetical protein
MLAEHMRKSRALRVAALWWLLGVSGALAAEDADLPEMDFLEYLGLWEESDEDWVLFSVEASEQLAATKLRTDPAPESEESAESDDES